MAKVAVVGAGISGLYAAWLMAAKHDVTVYEADNRLGGHADTDVLNLSNRSLHIDTGFIVFNRDNYPGFSALIDDLSIETCATDMSFSVNDENSGISYCASSDWRELFADGMNLVRPSFWAMLKDIRKFYRTAKAHYLQVDDNLSLGEYLQRHSYSKAFRDLHLVPMAAALWSASYEEICSYPMKYMLEFMQNHRMLQFLERPQWLTIKGGSQKYVQALRGRTPAKFLNNEAVVSVERCSNTVIVQSVQKTRDFDAVIFACHSDQALALLRDPSDDEISVLGRIKYQRNDITLHSDTAVMPSNKKKWGSWHVHVPAVSLQEQAKCTVTYYMNRLQNIHNGVDYFVSLNQRDMIRAEYIHSEKVYYHPVYTKDTCVAQKQWPVINHGRSFFAGAYWGWGFHEDGVRSARMAVSRLNESFP